MAADPRVAIVARMAATMMASSKDNVGATQTTVNAIAQDAWRLYDAVVGAGRGHPSDDGPVKTLDVSAPPADRK